VPSSAIVSCEVVSQGVERLGLTDWRTVRYSSVL